MIKQWNLNKSSDWQRGSSLCIEYKISPRMVSCLCQLNNSFLFSVNSGCVETIIKTNLVYVSEDTKLSLVEKYITALYKCIYPACNV